MYKRGHTTARAMRTRGLSLVVAGGVGGAGYEASWMAGWLGGREGGGYRTCAEAMSGFVRGFP